MRIFAFDPGSGRPLTSWIDERGASHRVDPKTSKVVISPLLTLPERAERGTAVLCFHVGAGGFLPRHPAGAPQLFAVVAGSGWVTGADDVKVELRAGRAAFWDAGESHAAGTEEGMTVIVVEGTSFDPAAHMREVRR